MFCSNWRTLKVIPVHGTFSVQDIFSGLDAYKKIMNFCLTHMCAL